MTSVVTDPDLFQSGKLFSNDTLGDISWNGREHNRLFRNDGNKRFIDVASGVGVDAVEDGRSAIFFDMDRDGDLDLLVTNMNRSVRLFRNNRGNQRNWLMVRPVGVTTNRQAVGATIKVTAGGSTMVRPVLAGQGFQSSYCGPIHFGLGNAEKADRLEILFPGGASILLTDVAARQFVTISQDGRIVRRHGPAPMRFLQPVGDQASVATVGR